MESTPIGLASTGKSVSTIMSPTEDESNTSKSSGSRRPSLSPYPPSSAPPKSVTHVKVKVPHNTAGKTLTTISSQLSGSTDLSGGKKDAIPHIRNETLAELEENYLLLDVIGQGAFGVVRLAEQKSNGKTYACKTIKKKQGSVSMYEQLQREVTIMKVVSHPNIVQLKEVYESSKKIVMIMEYCAGGELVQTVRKNGGCPIHEIKSITIQLVDAVTYLHRHGIIHRDIKPENILLKSASPEDPFIIKVSDFGLACFADAANHLDNVAGTPMYMAPEIIQKLGYSHQCDIWSIGVMLYILLCNYKKEVETLMQEMVKAGKIEYPEKYWEKIPVQAKNLCDMILKFDPAKRVSAGEILRHPWLNLSKTASEEDPDTYVNTNVLDLMKSYNAERRLRKGIWTVIGMLRFRLGIKAHSAIPEQAESVQSLHNYKASVTSRRTSGSMQLDPSQSPPGSLDTVTRSRDIPSSRDAIEPGRPSTLTVNQLNPIRKAVSQNHTFIAEPSSSKPGSMHLDDEITPLHHRMKKDRDLEPIKRDSVSSVSQAEIKELEQSVKNTAISKAKPTKRPSNNLTLGVPGGTPSQTRRDPSSISSTNSPVSPLKSPAIYSPTGDDYKLAKPRTRTNSTSTDASLPKLKLPQAIGLENNLPSGGLKPKKKDYP